MSSRLIRIWLVPLLLLASEVWALGLGEIRLSSALNAPLRAEIELLSATPDELENLRVQLASAETFQRYDLDRPLFLTQLQFEIVRSGRSDGNVVRVTSDQPVTEPFITFLVEASWSRGRLLREYTLLLDPPTFAPPPTTQATQPVTAPTRQQPADSGQIQRPQPEPAPAPPPQQRPAVQAPVQTPPQETPSPVQEAPSPVQETPVSQEPVQPEPAPPAQTPDTFGQPDFDTASGGDVLVQRGDTLWGITRQVRPDSRLSINQTMLAIFEANPEAFAGNINMLRAGATLRIPSADDIFRISRGDAFSEVARQNEEWSSGRPFTPAPAPAPTIVDPADTSPSLTLVPPDDEDEISLTDISVDTGAEDTVEEPLLTDPVEERIRELERMLEDQDALIEIPDTELAALRQELAELRGDPLPVDAGLEDPVDDEIPVVDEAPVEDATEPVTETAPPVVTQAQPEESLLDKVWGIVSNFWVIIGTALVLAVLVLVWFMRRAGGDDDEDMTGVWDALDADEMEPELVGSTERLSALARDDGAIVVEETRQVEIPDEEDLGGDTVLRPVAVEPEDVPDVEPEPLAEDPLSDTGTNRALEDTFSSDTAINLDQSDPIAEADFHMAYGLYDQAADLVNGVLTAEPDRQDLLAKLCEIYFVWGNRDGFVDAATRMRAQVSNDADAEWSKIVIMGQQIAADHELFTGASAEGMTKAVDLSLDSDSDSAADLDIDFAGEPDVDAAEIFDLGAEPGPVIGDETGQVPIPADTGTGIDFDLDDDDDMDVAVTREMPEPTVESPTMEAMPDDETIESRPTVETPTIEEQFSLAATGEIPVANEEIEAVEATAEIDLDDLGLDLDSLDETQADTGIADDSQFIDMSGFDDVEAADDEGADLVADDTEETGKRSEPEDVDLLAVSATREMPMTGDSFEETGTGEALDELEETGAGDAFDDLDFEDTAEPLDEDALAETGRNPDLDIADDEPTGASEIPEIEEALSGTSEMPSLQDAVDEDAVTGLMPAIEEPVAGDDEATEMATFDDLEDTDVGLDTSLLDATGHTQVLTDDMAVDTVRDLESPIDDDEATMMAPDYGDEEATRAADDTEVLLAPMGDDEDDEFDFAKTEALPKDSFSTDMSSDETGAMPGLAGGTDLDLDLDDLTAALKVSEVGDTINQPRDDATVEQPRIQPSDDFDETSETSMTQALAPEDLSADLNDARTMTEVGTKLDLARAYVDMGDPDGAKSILEEVLDEGDEAQRQQAQQLMDSLPA